MYFKNAIGVSAGACHACSYYCKQRERALRVSVDYLDDKNYCGFYSLIKTGDFFGTEMVYRTIPQKYYPLDNNAFKGMGVNFYATVTNCKSGKPEYIKINDVNKDIDVIRASASLPLMSKMVEMNGSKYLDGGIADSIPIKQSEKMGVNKNVVILTQPRNYQKKPNSIYPLMKVKYRKYKNLLYSIKNRHTVYNQTLKYIYDQEKMGNIFVISPKADLGIGRIEKDKDKLEQIYKIGYNDGKLCYEKLLEFINN